MSDWLDPHPSPETVIADAARLHQEGRGEAARAPLQRAMATHPNHAALHNALGVAHATAGSFDLAWRCYMQAARLAPEEAGIWTNAGNAATRLGRHATALACHRVALERAPLDGGFHYNLGIALAAAGQHPQAVGAFTRALQLLPNHRMARWDRALSLLALGNYPAGFADYESRLANALVPARELPGQRWDGTPYAGKHLLILAEQGFGDMIWVARYLPMAKALGGKLTVECRRPLVRLIESQGIADRVLCNGDPLPNADLHIHQGSLPGLFTADAAAIPSTPYLTVQASWCQAARARLGSPDGQLRVGIVWSGSAAFARNDQRAQPLSRFIAAFALPNVRLYSLQLGPQQDERTASDEIIDLAPDIRDFADTAGLIAELDLIVMTDTAVAHLAGALGKPVWLLVGPNPHFLWHKTSLWYPSIRVFACRHENDWAHPFDEATSAMLEMALRK